MALVDGFLELERSSGKLEWSAILQKMASDLGFSKILFGLLPKDSQDYENAFIVGNYPAAWREHYDRAGYARGSTRRSVTVPRAYCRFSGNRPSTRRESSTSSSRKPRPPAWCMG